MAFGASQYLLPTPAMCKKETVQQRRSVDTRVLQEYSLKWTLKGTHTLVCTSGGAPKGSMQNPTTVCFLFRKSST